MSDEQLSRTTRVRKGTVSGGPQDRCGQGGGRGPSRVFTSRGEVRIGKRSGTESVRPGRRSSIFEIRTSSDRRAGHRGEDTKGSSPMSDIPGQGRRDVVLGTGGAVHAMVPHEREIVERLKNKPVASRRQLRCRPDEAEGGEDKSKITWRSFGAARKEPEAIPPRMEVHAGLKFTLRIKASSARGIRTAKRGQSHRQLVGRSGRGAVDAAILGSFGWDCGWATYDAAGLKHAA